MGKSDQPKGFKQLIITYSEITFIRPVWWEEEEEEGLVIKAQDWETEDVSSISGSATELFYVLGKILNSLDT